MHRFIGTNETHYSTSDIDEIALSLYTLAKAESPEKRFGKAWKGWSWRFGSDKDNVGLCYWKDPRPHEVRGLRSSSGYSSATKRTENGSYSGPWFYKEIRPRYQRNGNRNVHVLSPKHLLETMSPVEALSLAGEEPQLPKGMVAQLLWKIFSLRGVGLMSPTQSSGGYGQPDAPGLRSLIEQFLEERGSASRVRILRKIEDPPEKRKLSTEDSIRRLLDTYTGGNAARGMGHKLWTLRNKADEYFRYWEQTEKQRARVEKKAGRMAAPVHDSPADMLRKLADEYDRRIKEGK